MRRTMLVCSSLLVGAAACHASAPAVSDFASEAGAATLSSAPLSPADEEVTGAIEGRIEANRGTEPQTAHVAVSTHAGVVTLRGHVATQLDKQRIYQIAATTPGVSSVVDDVLAPEENPSVLNDEQIQKDIQSRLDLRGSKGVRVSAAGGKVILQGDVLTNVEKVELEKVAAQTPNVTSIDNQLHVKPLDKP